MTLTARLRKGRQRAQGIRVGEYSFEMAGSVDNQRGANPPLTHLCRHDTDIGFWRNTVRVGGHNIFDRRAIRIESTGANQHVKITLSEQSDDTTADPHGKVTNMVLAQTFASGRERFLRCDGMRCHGHESTDW